jgi:heme exporter protein C
MINILTPNFFFKYYKLTLKILTVSFIPILISALYQALIASPIDYQQGELVRIMYVHVPSAWLSMGIYLLMALCGMANIVWGNRLAYIIAASSAPIGASFALITLVTGSIWGYPAWGTWWVWDARLTSMLVLFLFYISYILLFSQNPRKAEKPCSIVSLIGAINVPIVKFSVDIWASLHQGASIITLSGPKVHSSMLKPLFLMFVAFCILFAIVLILRAATLMAKFKRSKDYIYR